MYRIIEVIPKNNLIVALRFTDGFSANLDVKQFIKGGISEELRSPDVFDNVRVDDFGGIAWPNGFDFCPNFLREYLQAGKPQ